MTKRHCSYSWKGGKKAAFHTHNDVINSWDSWLSFFLRRDTQTIALPITVLLQAVYPSNNPSENIQQLLWDCSWCCTLIPQILREIYVHITPVMVSGLFRSGFELNMLFVCVQLYLMGPAGAVSQGGKKKKMLTWINAQKKRSAIVSKLSLETLFGCISNGLEAQRHHHFILEVLQHPAFLREEQRHVGEGCNTCLLGCPRGLRGRNHCKQNRHCWSIRQNGRERHLF